MFINGNLFSFISCSLLLKSLNFQFRMLFPFLVLFFSKGGEFKFSKYHTRIIISRGLYIFYPFFEDHISLLLRRFFKKILSLCMASIKEGFIINSGLWWRTLKVAQSFAGVAYNHRFTIVGMSQWCCIMINILNVKMHIPLCSMC